MEEEASRRLRAAASHPQSHLSSPSESQTITPESSYINVRGVEAIIDALAEELQKKAEERWRWIEQWMLQFQSPFDMVDDELQL
ncbi:hypothetical protein DY000_02030049 [Brassica cretica]|uniref:Uncharacterized protein n=1 Tax=Brassica cretica TaxID=69181 RepID=A0ABQ7DDI0_BRACR|nr:hypothetical protein DY000_02030049 [Brassica cretica]